MLKRTMSNPQEMYGVYYFVYGSLAGVDSLVKAYLWSGPYPDLKSALLEAENLKITHQNDDSFIVKKYKEDK